MAKVYFVRHQAHGVVDEFPFASHPTQEQVARVAKYCFQAHGFGHPKTPNEPYWTKVVDVDVLGPDELPAFKDRELQSIGAGDVGSLETALGGALISGAGTITPKGR